jgi:hypothetical protein
MEIVNSYTDLMGVDIVILGLGNNEFLSMPKADYEAQQATLAANSAPQAHSTES